MAKPAHPWKTALVTGASAGIGEAIAEELVAHGVRTVVVARRSDRLEQMAKQSTLVEPLVADLLTSEGCEIVRARLTDPNAPIELLVNNAGYGYSGNVADLPREGAVGMVDLNVRALTDLTQAVLPSMVAANRGWILQVSSVASFQPGPGAAIYSATKAYVTSFTEALHEELRSTNVNVCALCPGFTRTEFHAVSNMTDDDITRVPGFAWLRADRVARSGLAAVAAGKALDVPGGLYKGIGALTNSLPRSVARRVMGITTKRG
jgi:uncharacterized protein